jgi:hypothetical protein
MGMKRTILLLIVIVIFSITVRPTAQQPQPNLEIVVAKLTIGGQPMAAGPLANISNSPGYDSQPSFLPDGSGVLFSSQRTGTQYDIYKYDFASQKVVQVTNTADNENSPIVTPDGKTFSVIRSELPGGAENQRLWRFNLDGSNPTVVLPDLRRIGYHVWVDATHLVLYVLAAAQGEPNTLQFVDTTTGKAEVIDTQVGRSLLKRPFTDKVTYVRQPRGEKAMVMEFDPKAKQSTPLVEGVEGSTNRDMAWHVRGVLLMSAGTKVFAWTPPSGSASGPAPATSWVEAGDFASAGVANITRMALGPLSPGLSDGAVKLVFAAELVAK